MKVPGFLASLLRAEVRLDLFPGGLDVSANVRFGGVPILDAEWSGEVERLSGYDLPAVRLLLDGGRVEVFVGGVKLPGRVKS